MKQLIVYDLDGTLVDTLDDIAEAVNYMLARCAAAPLSRHEVRRFIGGGVHDLVKECLRTEDEQRVAEGVRIYRAYYGQHLVDHSVLYPGARDALRFFRDRHQAVITNKPNPYSRDILNTLGVAEFFLEIVAGGAPYPRKPDPASLRGLMAKVRAAPEHTVLIGDSAIDIETGRQAGVLTVATTHGFEEEAVLRSARPDLMVGSFHELLALARAGGW